MNCNNPKCQREIKNYYTCNKCGKVFCTNACITEHTLERHSNQIDDTSIPRRVSGTR